MNIIFYSSDDALYEDLKSHLSIEFNVNYIYKELEKTEFNILNPDFQTHTIKEWQRVLALFYSLLFASNVLNAKHHHFWLSNQNYIYIHLVPHESNKMDK